MEFNTNFPLDDRLYSSLKKCGRNLETEQYEFQSTDTLLPNLIEIYAEVGHLTTFCSTENAPLFENEVFIEMNNILQKENLSALLDLDKLSSG